MDISGIELQLTNNNASYGYGENWDESNLETLSDWVHIGALQIETLDLAIKRYRGLIRQNVLMGLILSTASGSISITQLSSSAQIFILNIFFTVMSFSMAILTGLIKIYQIQERLEEYIQLKQEWITFCVNITSEIQLPVSQRRDALRLIKDYKGKYLDLLKIDVDISNALKEKALENLYDDEKMQHVEERNKYRKLKNEVNNDYTEDNNPCNNNETEVDLCCGPQWCKKKFDGKKTSLSNIILTIVMEEEKSERDKQMMMLYKIKKEMAARESERRKSKEQYQMHVPETNQHILLNENEKQDSEEINVGIIQGNNI